MPLLILTTRSIAATAYTISDARSRRMNATGWGVFVMSTGMLGWPVYFMVRRPKTA